MDFHWRPRASPPGVHVGKQISFFGNPSERVFPNQIRPWDLIRCDSLHSEFQALQHILLLVLLPVAVADNQGEVADIAALAVEQATSSATLPLEYNPHSAEVVGEVFVVRSLAEHSHSSAEAVGEFEVHTLHTAEASADTLAHIAAPEVLAAQEPAVAQFVVAD